MDGRITFSLVGAICLWVSAPAVLVAQLLVWFRTGNWPPWTFGDACSFVGLGRPFTGMGSVQQVTDWVWSWPLWLGLFVSTAILAALVPSPRRG